MVGATAYIADISEKEERAFRIGEKPTVTRSVAKTKLDKINSISQNFYFFIFLFIFALQTYIKCLQY